MTQNKQGLGYIGDLVQVAQGYAQNYLIPKGIAVPATARELKRSQKLRDERVKAQEEIAKDTEKFAKELQGLELVFNKKAGKNGKIFGGVSENDVLAGLEKEAKIKLDKSHIHFEKGHPKTIGKHSVDIHLHGGHHVEIIVEIKKAD